MPIGEVMSNHTCFDQVPAAVSEVGSCGSDVDPRKLSKIHSSRTLYYYSEYSLR